MAIKRLKKDTFEVRCRYQGKAVRRRFADKWEAREFEELVVAKGLNPDHAAAKIRGFTIADERTSPSFREFVETKWLPDLRSGEAAQDEEPVTVGTAAKNEQRLNILYPLIGDRRLDAFTEGDWQDLKRTLREAPLNRGRPYAPGTANVMLKRARQVLRYAAAKGYIQANPWEHGRLLKDARPDKVFWRPGECEQFLSTVKGLDQVHYLYFLLALNTAMRKGELFGLRKRDLDFEDRLIYVRRQWDSDAYEHGPREVAFKNILKNGEALKVIPMTEDVYTELRPHATAILGGDTRLFYFPVGFMKDPSGPFRRYARKAGVPEIKAHGTRDCAIGNLKRAGVSDRLIAQIAGCRVQNLDSYGHLDHRDVAAAVNLISTRGH